MEGELENEAGNGHPADMHYPNVINQRRFNG
jgi:hypothetical protein